jgi:hypothetical protein
MDKPLQDMTKEELITECRRLKVRLESILIRAQRGLDEADKEDDPGFKAEALSLACGVIVLIAEKTIEAVS